MSYTIELQVLEPQPSLTIRRLVPMAEIAKAMAEMLPAVFAYLGQIGVEPAAPPFSLYHGAGQEVDMEVGAIVPVPVAGRGEIQASQLPGGEVVTTWHVGPYDQLLHAYQALQDWMAANGRHPGGPMWEIYWTDPNQEPDARQWRTQIFWPLAAT